MLSDKSVRVPDTRDTSDEKCPSIAGHSETTTEGLGHARVPRAVTSDRKLKDRDTRVFEALGQLERKGYVRCGIRLIGETCTKSKSQVARSLAILIARGYVDYFPGKRGQRASYRLTAAIFKAEATPPPVIAKKAKRGTVKLGPCLKCGKSCKPSKADGWCRACIQEAKTRGIVRQEIRRMDREVRDEPA